MLTEQDLAQILWDAEEFYDNRGADCAEDQVRIAALRIAAVALSENEDHIDKYKAKDMAHDMALLANWMLHAKGATEWDPMTQVALQKIRGSDRDVVRYAPKAPTLTPFDAA